MQSFTSKSAAVAVALNSFLDICAERLQVFANCIWRLQARFDNASCVDWEVACASFLPSSDPFSP
jgi:hypothetical protein